MVDWRCMVCASMCRDQRNSLKANNGASEKWMLILLWYQDQNEKLNKSFRIRLKIEKCFMKWIFMQFMLLQLQQHVHLSHSLYMLQCAFFLTLRCATSSTVGWLATTSTHLPIDIHSMSIRKLLSWNKCFKKCRVAEETPTNLRFKIARCQWAEWVRIHVSKQWKMKKAERSVSNKHEK